MTQLYIPRGFALPQILSADHELARLTLLRLVPEQVYLWGQVPPGPWVSIVGTRRPTQQGALAAYELARQLAAAGVCVVSGGAMGVDTAAHRGALDGGGKTLVVAPSWLKNAYPSENRPIFDEIIEGGGGYLSLSKEEQHPFNPVFFYRNEALVALSDVVVLGDCPVRSGARNAMHHARRLAKPRFCLPTVFDSAQSVGNWLESQELGAVPIVHAEPIYKSLEVQDRAQHGDRFREFCQQRGQQADKVAKRRGKTAPRLGGKGPSHPRTTNPEAQALLHGLDEEAQHIAQAIGGGCLTADDVAERTGLPVASVQHQILILTLNGVVFQDESGILRYQTRSHG